MLLQTNSYIVPKDRRSEHARLLRKFRQTLARLGCDQFEVYEQVGANWATGEATGRFVQIMRFRDRKHQLDVQAAEKLDPAAQQLIQEFCALINFPYQQQQGLFAVGFYTSSLQAAGTRAGNRPPPSPQPASPAPPPPLPTSGAGASAPAAAATTMTAAAATAAAVGPDPSVLDDFELPEPTTTTTGGEGEGSSILDFAALSPAGAEEAPPPMRLTPDADEVIESSVEPPNLPALPAQPLEAAPNGEHAGSFADTSDGLLDDDDVDLPAADDLLTDSDRESVLGELVDEDDERGRKGGR